MQVLLGDVVLDLGEQIVRRPDGTAPLTTLEADFLRFLVARRGDALSRDLLLSEVWGYSPRTQSRAVDHTVSRLRRKIEFDPKRPTWITAIRGGGYRLESEPTILDAEPLEPSAFIGRQAELADLLTQLQGHPCVRLTGPEGIGKSRLARRIGLTWPHGSIHHVDLGGVEDQDVALWRLRRGLGITPGRLMDALGGRPGALIVVDHAEGLTSWAPPDETTGANVLLVHRGGSRGETFSLGPLRGPSAEALFLLRSGPRQGASRWGGVPLALELAAPLADPMEAIGDAPLAAALTLAWGALSPPLQQLMSRAAWFGGAWSVDDLEAVSGTPHLLDGCCDLQDRGWLQPAPPAPGGPRLVVPGAAGRFVRARPDADTDTDRHRMVAWSVGAAPRLSEAELIHALTLAEGASDARALLAAMPSGEVSPVDAAWRRLGPPDDPRWFAVRGLARVETDPRGAREDLSVARRGLDPASTVGRRVAIGLAHAHWAEGPGGPGADVLAILDAAGDRVAAGLLRLSRARGAIAGSPETTRPILLHALQDLAQHGTPQALGEVHALLARTTERGAMDHADRAETLLREASDPSPLARFLAWRADDQRSIDPSRSRRWAAEGEDLARQYGHVEVAAHCRCVVADLDLTAGEARQAWDHAQAALALHDGRVPRRSAAISALALGHLDDAERLTQAWADADRREEHADPWIDVVRILLGTARGEDVGGDRHRLPGAYRIWIEGAIAGTTRPTPVPVPAGLSRLARRLLRT